MIDSSTPIIKQQASGTAMLAEASVDKLQGVGSKLANRLADYGVQTIQDVLFHLPLRYQDRTHLTPLNALQDGMEVLVEGIISEVQLLRGARSMLLVSIRDNTHASLSLRFFHFQQAQIKAFRQGERIRCFGEVRTGFRSLEMVHPVYRIGRLDDLEPGATLTPVYPTTEGLTQRLWLDITSQALALLEQGGVPDYVPPAILKPLELPELNDALHILHRPPAEVAIADILNQRHPAFARLAFEEILAFQLALRQLRQQQQREQAPVLKVAGQLPRRLQTSLPYQLTNAQQRVIAEIKADLLKPQPMHRLVQGDVGSGKTIVAAMAALCAVEAGYQAIIMAPTELLAEQHRRNFTQWLTPLGVAVGWLAGKQPAAERREMLTVIAEHQVNVIVGTHALIQQTVEFARPGLIVIDEQHRFGVHQRLALRLKSQTANLHPHQLIMTATPIPRSLAMTAYADLDLSIIDELPPGRQPVTTSVFSDSRREEIIARVAAQCRQGSQAYWVCTLIEESEELTAQAAEDVAKTLREMLPDLQIGLVHGQMKSAERTDVMRQFAAGELVLLVATTVIEVGVDVPNASLMIIENPERLGLSQLHQLRGRVGRGKRASHCVLLYHHPLSAQARERLQVMRETSNGFVIAERDLELRGAGELLGTKQIGSMRFRMADLLRDQHYLTAAQQAAELMLKQYPKQVTPLIRRWLGARLDYTRV